MWTAADAYYVDTLEVGRPLRVPTEVLHSALGQASRLYTVRSDKRRDWWCIVIAIRLGRDCGVVAS